MKFKCLIFTIVPIGLCVALSACGSSGDSASTSTDLKISGSVSGLASGSQFTLQNNGIDPLTVTANGPITFAAPVTANGRYDVTVAVQPDGQTCSVANNTGGGSGVMADVSSVTIVCSANTYTVGGTLTGLASGAQLVLQDNGADSTTLTANGPFSFASAVPFNGSYVVSVANQPSGQTCSVEHASGAGVTANVTSASVTCSNNSFAVSGQVSGLTAGRQVTLLNNGADPLTVTADGAFAFTAPIAQGGSYGVTVGTQPTGQTCSISAGAGSIVATNVVNVAVTCSTNTVTVGGTLSGLAADSQITLQNNGADPLTLTADGAFGFAMPIVQGNPYVVTVGTQPRWQACSLTDASATANANVSNVVVTCTGSASVTTVAASSSFGWITGAAVDAAGNLYVVDQGNNRIDKVTPSGTVTTLAGSGNPESTNGNGTAASFYAPTNVALDAAGNLYVADYRNNLIRKITSSGDVTTLAGSGSAGSTNGNGVAASFYSPYGVAADASGNVYVAEYRNHLIRKITPNGDVTTFAGSGSPGSANGNGTAASFYGPTSLAIDTGGNLYVADYGNNLIRKIAPNRDVTTLAGSGGPGAADGNRTSASFNGPFSVATDSAGSVFVADHGNNLVRRISANGYVTTLAGSGSVGAANGTGTAASFNEPTSVATDAAGNVYLTDAGNGSIRKIQ